MRICVLTLVVLLSQWSLGEELSVDNLTEPAPPVEVHRSHTPQWKFILGESNFNTATNGLLQSGLGLNAGIERRLNAFYAIGLDYTGIKTSDWNNADVYTSYLSFTPIRYEAGAVEVTGSLQGGILTGDYSWRNTNPNFFYGGALAINLSKKIGLSFSTKVCWDINSLTAVSLLGYF